ncbi:RNA-binding protein 33-like [Dreissena polymorpha]|uniref:Uncharacterized protein n=1 Tax=Dreissena polymorpha TaxID=45954 RepID=A0A9D4DCG6_DREPO|nr:RNA-binding protein 33-like [Dreissena polymorpha]KAH3741741.1 hypothetical protein DPMN_048466 [Dreissena polymorpha]
MPRKRPTEASWDSSDDELLQDSGTSAFGSRKDEEIDEDVLLGITPGDQKDNSLLELSSEIEIGLDTSTGVDIQELDYEDTVPDEVSLDGETEIEEALVVDEQPNETTANMQGTIELVAPGNESDSDEEKEGRSRFQTERQTISIKSNSVSYSKTTDIPDSLEVTKEMQEEIDSFEKKSNQKFPRQNKQQQQQNFQQRQRGGQFRQPNPRNQRYSQPQRPGFQRGGFQQGGFRGPGPQNFQPQGFSSTQAGNYRFRGPSQQGFQTPPRGPMERFHSPPNGAPQLSAAPRGQTDNYMGFPQGPQGNHQQMQSTAVVQQHFQQHQQQHNFPSTQESPHLLPNPSMGAYPSQPQPLYAPSVPTPSMGSNIHVNPNFHGHIPSEIRPLIRVPPTSSSQGAHQQYDPQSQYQQNWSSPPGPGSYSSTHHPSQAPSQPVYAAGSQPHPQGSLLGPGPGPGQPGILNNPRPAYQQQQHRPMRPQGPQQGYRPQNPSVRPLSSQQSRPLANQNPRNVRPRGPAVGNVRAINMNTMPAPQRPPAPMGAPAGWNPPPQQLINTNEPIDPEKLRQQQELEERKKKRAARFASVTPVEVKPEEAKVIKLTSKRPSNDPNDVSPAKVIKIEHSTAENDSKAVESTVGLSDYERAIVEQKRTRERVLKQKESHRLAEAAKRRGQLKAKLAMQGQTLDDVTGPVQDASLEQNITEHNIANISARGRGRGQPSSRGQMLARGQPSARGQTSTRGQPTMQGQVQSRGHNMNHGQTMNRGNFHNNNNNSVNSSAHLGQPISVLGQSQSPMVTPTRGQGQRGRGNVRGQLRSQKSFGQLQQVKIIDNVDFVNFHGKGGSLTPMGDASLGQGHNDGIQMTSGQNRLVRSAPDEHSPKRRIVIDSKQSFSTVAVTGLPKNADLSKINNICKGIGNVKMFNFFPDESKVTVMFGDPTQAKAFLAKHSRFMVDMTMLTAKLVPDS